MTLSLCLVFEFLEAGPDLPDFKVQGHSWVAMLLNVKSDTKDLHRVEPLLREQAFTFSKRNVM